VSKSAFFAAAAVLPTKVVNVPGYGPLSVRGLTSAEYDEFEAASTVKTAAGKQEFKADRAVLVKLGALQNESDEPLFTDADLPKLRDLPARVLVPVARAILDLSGAGEDSAGN
jgi:hypothetical protein